MGQRNQSAKQWHAADKGFGSVDWIEDPDELGIFARSAEFLANDAMLRKSLLDQFAHCLLGGAVGGGHRGLVGLVVYR